MREGPAGREEMYSGPFFWWQSTERRELNTQIFAREASPPAHFSCFREIENKCTKCLFGLHN